MGRQHPCCSDACGVRFHGVLAPRRPSAPKGLPASGHHAAGRLIGVTLHYA